MKRMDARHLVATQKFQNIRQRVGTNRTFFRHYAIDDRPTEIE